MSKQVPYSRRNLDLRAAEYYASIQTGRKKQLRIETAIRISHRVYAGLRALTLSMLIDADYLYA